MAKSLRGGTLYHDTNRYTGSHMSPTGILSYVRYPRNRPPPRGLSIHYCYSLYTLGPVSAYHTVDAAEKRKALFPKTIQHILMIYIFDS